MNTRSISFFEALSGFSYWMMATGYSTSTIETYTGNLKRLCQKWDNPPLESINRDRIQGYLAKLKETGRSSETQRTYLKQFRLFLNWVSTEFETKEPDLSTLKSRQRTESDVEPFASEDVAALIKAARFTKQANTRRRAAFRMHRPTEKRDVAIILTLLDTGARASELCRVTIADTDLKNGEIRVRSFESCKKSKPRTLSLGKAARSAIWRYLAERGEVEQHEPLFLSKLGDPLNRGSLLKMVTGLGKDANVTKVHPHRFRHTFAIQYLRNGGDPFTLKRLLGHNSMKMVNYYLSISQEDISAAHKRASPVDNWRL
jgi:integrase/recombinase XerD